MFTGIIRHIGKVVEVRKEPASKETVCLTLQSPFASLSKGESICVDGVCLTVVDQKKKSGGVQFRAQVSEETCLKTTLKKIGSGSSVNLERALTLTDKIGGHFVQGHVDGTGKLISIQRQKNSKVYEFSYPPRLSPFLAEKGSIAIDGISLTLVHVNQKNFTVSVLPFTEENTTLHLKKIGENFNIETDMLAKIVANQTLTMYKKGRS